MLIKSSDLKLCSTCPKQEACPYLKMLSSLFSVTSSNFNRQVSTPEIELELELTIKLNGCSIKLADELDQVI
jgi:hypothetical protein